MLGVQGSFLKCIWVTVRQALSEAPSDDEKLILIHTLREFGFNLRNQGIALLIDGVLRIK
jgi:hypothetical protein